MDEQEDPDDFDDQGREEAEESRSRQRQALSARTVHEALRFEGEEELNRYWGAIGWSGLAAGISMGLSMVAEGVLRRYLPEAPWTPLVSKLGYSVGFVAVTLGRQQLFTETTVTAVLPFLHRPSVPKFIKVARFWMVALTMNLVGGFIFAWAASHEALFGAELREAFLHIGRETGQHAAWPAFVRGIVGGWMIALMVWLMPSAASNRLWVIILMTYLLGVSGLTHVIAGSLEMFYVIVSGELTFVDYLVGYGLPVLLGNTFGGVVFVSLLNHAQVAADEEE